jgi:glycosyltransferase involved in cell wall biosynthesis
MKMSVRPRILIFYSILVPNGGANSVAAWMIQALCKQFDVTLFTGRPIDLEKLNVMFGTSLRPSDFHIRLVPKLARAILSLDPDKGSIQEHAYMMRVCKRISKNYDLVLSADNEGDFGPNTIQYIHYPQLAHVYPRVSPTCDLPLIEKICAIAQGRIRPWMLLGDFSYDRMKQTYTLVNSDWTGRWVGREYGIRSVTVHPPASGLFPAIPWADREDGFVIVGRFNQGKRQDWVVQVLNRVRVAFPKIHLHVVGTESVYPIDKGYFESLTRILDAHRDWVTLHVDLPRQDLARLLASQRYGIHAMFDEHFGMAVAEIVAAGCIPFVHGSGGPKDIVGNDPRLLYLDEEEAVAKISAVLADQCMQRNILARLAPRVRAYSPEGFMEAIRGEAERAIASRAAARNPSTN